MQTTSHILMIRPVNFGFNAQTAVNNAFQVATADQQVQEKAAQEFDGFVQVLRTNGLDVIVVNDTPEPYTPDSIFPNNWISFHEDGTILLYPMFAMNRRAERKQHVIEAIQQRFALRQTIDLTGMENEAIFLEGTGSMVLDRDNRIAYACISPRTDERAVQEFCDLMHYQPCVFHAVDSAGREIYHTNVMMCVADQYVVACLASIQDQSECEMFSSTIRQTGKVIVDISFSQMNQFAGNMLQVENKRGDKLLVMSTRAFSSLTAEQLNILGSFNQIIHAPLTTIEDNGGGSARCMMAEVHLAELD